MATIGLSPIDFYNINSFSFTESWQVPHGSSIQLYFVLNQSDSLGTRRYIPSQGSVITLTFMRQRQLNTITPGGTNAQSITKTATLVDPRDTSVYTIQLTAEDTKTIISGGVVLSVSSGGNVQSYSIPYTVKKIRSNAGC